MVRARLYPQYGTLYKTVPSNIDGTLNYGTCRTEPSNIVRARLPSSVVHCMCKTLPSNTVG